MKNFILITICLFGWYTWSEEPNTICQDCQNSGFVLIIEQKTVLCDTCNGKGYDGYYRRPQDPWNPKRRKCKTCSASGELIVKTERTICCKSCFSILGNFLHKLDGQTSSNQLVEGNKLFFLRALEVIKRNQWNLFKETVTEKTITGLLSEKIFKQLEELNKRWQKAQHSNK